MSERANGAAVLADRRYARTSVRLGVDPITGGVGLTRAVGGSFLLYERSGEVAVGFGAAAEIVVNRHEIRLRGFGGGFGGGTAGWHRVPTGEQPLQQVR
jgi:hypothetical protein